ncbi:MAG: hypothetical protein K8R60_06825 [Burkholderiales bacterium]|nr:hypothetical protein [Burkholderiales bacterium]
MATIVRTTGGLLQLKSKQLSVRDYGRIVEFAKNLGDESVRKRLEQQTQMRVHGSQSERQTQSRKPEPVDLQAVTPDVFR